MQTLGAEASAYFFSSFLFCFSFHLQLFLNVPLVLSSSLTYITNSVQGGLTGLALNLDHLYLKSSSITDQMCDLEQISEALLPSSRVPKM